MSNDPLEQPSTAYKSLDEKQYKPELALADMYQAFTAELLRLALLGIAAFGFLYKEAFVTFDPIKQPGVNISAISAAKSLASAGIFFFGATAVFALVFRYFSSESVRLYLEGLRFIASADQQRGAYKLKQRGWVVIVCIISKAGAAIALAAGALLTSLTFVQLLK